MYRIALLALACAAPGIAQDAWRVLPIRSQQEYEQGLAGGEAEQFPHAMSRCYYRPEHLWLGHDIGGAWRSSDSGKTWYKCLDKGLFLPVTVGLAVDPADPEIALIAVDNSFNWLAADAEGIYRTTDGGENWTRVLAVATNYNSGLHRIFQATIAYDPATADSITPAGRWYAAIHNRGLYRSDDGAVSWSTEAVCGLAGHATIHVVQPHPSDGRTVYVGSSQGLFRSDSLGYRLEPCGELAEGEVTSVFINPQDPAEVRVVVRGRGLYRSVDTAASFTLMRSHNSAHVFVNQKHPSCMYLIAQSGTSYVTMDNGVNWTPLPQATTFPGLGRESVWRRQWDGMLCAVLPSPVDSLEAVAHSRSTLFRTTDGGRSIQESATGFTGNAWGWYSSAVAFDPDDPGRIALFCYDVGMRLTLNGGNWFEPGTNAQAWNWYQAGEIGWLGTYGGSFMPVAGSQTIIETIGNYWSTRIALSRNNGAVWSLIGDTGTTALNLFIAWHPQDPAVVYAGGYISADSGATFTPVDFGGTYTRPEIVGMCDRAANVIYGMDHERRVLLRSRDQGATWSEYSRPGWQMRRLDPLPTFAAHPTDTSLVYSIDASGDLASFDGMAWRSLGVKAAAGGPAWNHVRSVTLDPNCPEVIYAGMFAHGGPAIMRSTDSGSTWIDVSANLPRMGASGMAVNPHTGELWKGSTAGTWILSPPYGTSVCPAALLPERPAHVRAVRRVGCAAARLPKGAALFDVQGRALETFQPRRLSGVVIAVTGR